MPFRGLGRAQNRNRDLIKPGLAVLISQCPVATVIGCERRFLGRK